ncbi:MAG: biotin synthase BioB [Candidatus Anammoximicrobium sp.]|nr:biotin synthase BioB [Candidatus Anammoximicrobium sp.]
MSQTLQAATTPRSPGVDDWHQLAEQVLSGRALTAEEGLAILRCPDDDLLDLLSAAFRIRRRFFGKTMRLNFLINAKSGLCPEDCHYCSQSRVSKAAIPKYNILDRQRLLDGARIAHERKAKTYCIVISARGPSEHELQAVEELVPEIKRQYDLKVCASLGLLTPEQAQRLKACGVDRINHNLNTSPEYYGQICSTHTYQDRIATLRTVRQAGLEICSGGIVGMGEADTDVVRMALELREVEADAIPVNFFHAVEGTPLEGLDALNPRYCLKVLCLFRFANPSREIRIAGGRELHLGSLQALGLYAANSIFVGDYLTTKGQAPPADYAMIEQLGFTVSTSAQVR